MSDLRGLPNIGTQAASELLASGIATATDLRNTGSLGAASALTSHGFSVCKSKLCALEGAIRGIRWHEIPSNERAALWAAFLDMRHAS